MFPVIAAEASVWYGDHTETIMMIIFRDQIYTLMCM